MTNLDFNNYIDEKFEYSESDASLYSDSLEQKRIDILKRTGICIPTSDYLDIKIPVPETEFDIKLRQFLNEFDDAVNPFMDKNIRFSSFSELLDKINVYIDEDSNYQFHRLNIYKETKNQFNNVTGRTMTKRTPNHFFYCLVASISYDSSSIVFHKFNKEKVGDNVEKLIIIEDDLNLDYNITKQTIKIEFPLEKATNARAITPSEKELIYQKMLLAIQNAKAITVDNMVEKGIAKKLIKNN